MSLLERYRAVRQRTASLCAPLSAEDAQLQSMPDASPAKWHLAHTTWFFERFVAAAVDRQTFDPAFEYLFNSYYDSVGPRVDRARRGLVSRPSLAHVHAYRADVDARVGRALVEGALDGAALAVVELGLHHEQQHQELILTDVKHALATQPLRPAYRADLARPAASTPTPLRWREHGGGIVEIGAPADGFAFDNERPRHRVLLESFQLATRPISNAEVLGFIADRGYATPSLWLSDGWATVRAEQWTAPLYWQRDGEGDHDSDGGATWSTYDLAGVRAIDPAATACHLSYYEADAIARWSSARLPTEAEWEAVAAGELIAGQFADDDHLTPRAAGAFSVSAGMQQLFGEIWQWTASPYVSYPRFQPLAGALGEYNGKFMSGQMVLRGGSCFTPRDHVRASYRNFFPPSARWQMAGVRLARD